MVFWEKRKLQLITIDLSTFFFFLTFDMDKLGKIRRPQLPSLKVICWKLTKIYIGPQSCENLQTFVLWWDVNVKFADFLELYLASLA